MDKRIIQCAMTGALTPQSLNPAIPVTPEQIAEDCIKVWKAGAAIVHIHVRDDEAHGCMDPARFRDVFKRIRDNTDLVINLTTAGGPTKTDEDRWEHVVELKPEMCTLDCGSFNWLPGGPYINSTQFLRNLGDVCKETGVKPEIEAFDIGQIEAAKFFVEEGHLETPLLFDLVMGVKGAMPATPEMLKTAISLMPEGSNWAATGIGIGHLPILYASVLYGGNVRVGLEDNVYYAKGQLATNEMLVQRAARVIRDFGAEVATPEEARQMLGLVKR